MKKYRLITTVFFLINPLFIQAQYFDWVQTYTGSEATGITSTNSIKESVVDSAGNIYIMGVCSVDAGFGGSRLIPFTAYGSYWNTPSIVIGGITPDGDLKWSKVVNSNNGHKTMFGHIQSVGDSVLACFVNRVSLFANSINAYTFFLDTLFRLCFYDSNGTLVYRQNLVYKGDTLDYALSRVVSAYVLMDYDGNTKETHWLTVAPFDRNGNLFEYDGIRYRNHPLFSDDSPFTIDNNGNIIIIRKMAEDASVYDSVSRHNIHYDITDPMVGGIRFYVDGKRYFDVPLPDARPSTGLHNYQILKFSPHFEELLASQFLFEPTPEHLDTICESTICELKCDKDNNLYLVVSSNYLLTETGESNRLKIGGADSLWLRFLGYDHNKGFLLKYDSVLNPVYLGYFERDSSLQLNGPGGLASGLSALHFDEDGKLLFIGGTTSSDPLITRCYFGDNEVELNKMFVRIDPQNGSAVTFGKRFCSEEVSVSSADVIDFIAKNNRIIWQIKYRWWLDFAGERYEKAEAYEWGMGFAVWDYDGNELFFVDYGTNGSSSHATSSVCLVDSVLYLTGMLASGGAQFGDITVPNSGSSQSFIARYVDTAFMHPYVRPGSQQDIQLVVRDGEPVVTVYPNPCAQRVTIDWDGDEPLASAFVTDISGRSYDIILKAAGQGRYTVDFSSMPPANYLLTLVTASGHRITSRLLKR